MARESLTQCVRVSGNPVLLHSYANAFDGAQIRSGDLQTGIGCFAGPETQQISESGRIRRIVKSQEARRAPFAARDRPGLLVI